MPKTPEEFYGPAYNHVKDQKLLDKSFRQMCLAYNSHLESIQARALTLAAKTELEAFAA